MRKNGCAAVGYTDIYYAAFVRGDKKLILAVTAPNANTVVQEAVSGWIGMARRGDHTALMSDTAD